MNPSSPPTQILLQFGAARAAVSRGLVSLLGLLPQLCDERFSECDVSLDAASDRCTCLVKLARSTPPEVAERLRYWAWQLGGVSSSAKDATSVAGAMARAVPAAALDWSARGVSDTELVAVARSLAERLSIPPHLPPWELALDLRLGRSRGDGLSFTLQDLTLFVPSPLALPIGDRLGLRLHGEGIPTLAAEGAVTAHRQAGQLGAGSPAGFVLGLVCPERQVVELLEAETSHATDAVRRRAPRYAACVPATVFRREPGLAAAVAPGPGSRPPTTGQERLTGGYVENLSQGGAFVNTARRLPEGTPVRLELSFPDGEALSVAGKVSHSLVHGLGIRFEPSQAEEAAIGGAVRRVAAMQPRALIVDDDQLARMMLSDAMTERGFTVFAAHDVRTGLAVLTDELLSLDLLITDLRMPGADGEQLIRMIREAGGEQDLAILVVSGDMDAALERRLQLAGADAVASKAGGTAEIQEAATRAFLMRARRRSARAGQGPDRFAILN